MTFHELNAKTLGGKETDFMTFVGKKVIVVNTASECGFTPQYAQLEELYQLLGPERLAILVFPCDQFGHQEPGGAGEIEKFCQLNYGLSFPIMEKTEVIGVNAHPVFKWLTNKSLNGQGDTVIAWNFHKFLVNEDGTLAKSVTSETSPLDPEVLDWLTV